MDKDIDLRDTHVLELMCINLFERHDGAMFTTHDHMDDWLEIEICSPHR